MQTLNQLTRALSQWENEGGATLSSPKENDGHVALSLAEQHILQCLGAAVITQWTELPTDVQKALFEQAASSGDPRHSMHLRDQIARFLHNQMRELGRGARQNRRIKTAAQSVEHFPPTRVE